LKSAAGRIARRRAEEKNRKFATTARTLGPYRRPDDRQCRSGRARQ